MITKIHQNKNGISNIKNNKAISFALSTLSAKGSMTEVWIKSKNILFNICSIVTANSSRNKI